MFNESCSIIIVAHSVIIAKLVVDPDLAGSHISQICRKFSDRQKYSRVAGLKYYRVIAHMYISRYAWHLVS